MAQESADPIQECLTYPSDERSPEPAEPSSQSRSSSAASRLNASAPEFVPRVPQRGDHHQHHHSPRHHHHHRQQHPHHHPPPPRMVPVHHPHPHHGPPPPPPMIHVFQAHPGPFHGPSPVVASGHGSFEYYGGNGGGISDHEAAHGHGSTESESGSASEHAAPGDGLPDEVVHKVTKQVEYYFSDVNLATTEHLMRFISKDSEGFVPISVLAPFKKIRALVSTNSQLAAALRTSSKLVVSEDGKKVRRQQPLTDVDLEELQSRIVVAENLPEDHCYQNLLKVFSVVGGVKTIRTCYPQNTNGTAPVNARPGKLDALLFNKLHAFVEYETFEQAEKAVLALNDEGNWRNGLRVRLLASCMQQRQGGQVRGKKTGNEGETNVEDDESSPPNPPQEKHSEDQPHEASNGQTGEDGYHEKVDGASKRGRARGRGGRGRGRGQYHNNNRNDGHHVGTPPTHHHHLQMDKQPPGPRMPDGTRGFTMGRGKPLSTSAPVS